MKTTRIVKNVKEIIANNLMDCVDEYGWYLHHKLFKLSSTYVHTDDAERALNQIGVFRAIHIVQNYEKILYFKTVTKMEPCAIANMLVYIAGCSLLNFSNTFNEKWNSILTEQDLLAIKGELEAYLRENPQDDLLSEWQ